MSDKPEHVLNLVYAELLKSERNLAHYKDEGWDECVEEEQSRLDDWKLLYDAVDGGLLADLKAASEALKSQLAVVS